MSELYTYALVNSLYVENKDYIDCFLPFVASVCTNEIIAEKNIQIKINEKYGLLIPIHTLRTIIARGKKQECLSGYKGNWSLTEKGNEWKDKINSDREAKRDIREFIEAFDQFLKEDRRKQVPYDEIEKCVYSYLDNNLESLRYFLKDNRSIDQKDDFADEHHCCLSDFAAFVETIEQSSNRLYDILANIVHGKIISLAISGLSDISEINKNFENTSLFLDTNVVFDLLGFQGDDAAKVTKEFAELTKKSGKFRLYVFEFTVDEICRVLAAYIKEQRRYIGDVEVNSIYYYMKQKGWNNAKVAEFIANIDVHLHNMGITVYDMRGVDLSGLDMPSQLSLLGKYKPGQRSEGKEHDIKAVDSIRQLRRASVRKVQAAKCFFLSQDFRLAKFSYIEHHHQRNQTIPEVMPEATLTNLLWLKEPKQIPLSTIMSFHKQYAIVSKVVWQVFQETMADAEKSDLGLLNDTSILLSYHRLQETLVSLPEDIQKADIISAIKSEAESIRSKTGKEFKQMVEEQKLLVGQLTVLAKAKEQDETNKIAAMQAKQLSALTKHKSKIREQACKDANVLFNFIRISVFILMVIRSHPKTLRRRITIQPS